MHSLLLLIHGISKLAFGLILLWPFIRDYKRTINPHGLRGFEVWTAEVPPLLFLGLMLILALITFLSSSAANGYQGYVICLALNTTLYYGLLAFLMPMLRRRYSARACACLWILPNINSNIVFIKLALYPFPLTALKLPFDVKNLLWIWFAGALLVAGFYGLQHILFCRRLFVNAHPAQGEVLALWERLQENARDPHLVDWKPLKLFISPNTRTPVSVGLRFARSRTVLPERAFTPEELDLIFRHELIHIYRRDAQTKLMLAVWTAFWWFNPLMWLASRRCREDIELCCDELALFEQPDARRREYARLLLGQTGDERGFTTCLSASFISLRYRIAGILKPAIRRSGLALLCFAAVLVLFGNGLMTVADSPLSLASASGFTVDMITQREKVDVDALLSTGRMQTTPYFPEIELELYDSSLSPLLRDDSAQTLWELLSTCKLYRVLGAYDKDNAPARADAAFTLPAGDKNVTVFIYGSYVWIESGGEEKLYVFSHKPDWRSLLLQ